MAGCPFETWSMKALREYLTVHGVDYSGCLEKRDLVSLCRATTWPLPPSTDVEANQCTICFEHLIDTVLVPCGHQYCSKCTYSQPGCPMCQQPVASRLRTFR